MVGSSSGLVPASLVSTMNSLISLAMPFCRPSPATRTLLALPSSLSPTMILNGLPLMCCPFLKTFTKCSPTSRGVKEIPEIKHTIIKYFLDKFSNYCQI